MPMELQILAGIVVGFSERRCRDVDAVRAARDSAATEKPMKPMIRMRKSMICRSSKDDGTY